MFRKSMVSALIAASLVFAVAGVSCAAEFARIGTSSVGGGFYLIGNTIAQLGNQEKNGINYTAVTGGSAKNLMALAKKDMEFGLAQSATVDEAWNGTGGFEGRALKQLRFVTAIYPMPAHILISGDGIESIADLKGKKIDYGPIGNGIDTNCRIVLGAYGIKDEDITIDRYGRSEVVEALQTGTVNGHIWLTTYPNAQITEMISKNVRLLSIDEEQRQTILKQCPFFASAVIPAGTYKGFDKDLPTIAAVGALITYADMSDEVIYKTVKMMYENSQFLKDRLPNYFANFSLENALNGCSMEVHPGALKYYKEAGLVK
ncbi:MULTISPECIES: TAXI family TRAP transporter solute-binding subunit [Aminobacterium]|jgi:TRAP transporter TAXI family solute receptor|uniref:TRAP transporter solute receptor, TAXI family n=1 Tax=Aminobacterium colombiense (strain DSM 12261 / ALA-1) TaxID=572547 RepID=D5EDF2_AMICL|nr:MULTISPECIES: TAXI family TRAP transporter solute-binding subunit [Aminobacterium]MDD2379105.1 TAXI family TRAP transporter solute-binding subunit [Aminobacterium colombiense]ADE56584.1 TRAP transporter solute receptor, TAXI family [Aminobacterium colombiense DSM 12261]MDD3768720.1 TAXI family TRAP transporter solute-binding subunit [Aminobacterium colombiense]MDD4265209.1 TAXI family TRAP transporter solute-binding subunit [Aminobacterium colombiense]MDD4585786.1 TAXI family TRAP transport